MSSIARGSRSTLAAFARRLGPLSSLLVAPLENTRLWTGLGWDDVVQSYRRTMLGPFWLTLNLAIFAAAMTLVYGALFGIPASDYAGYVVCGMMVWLWVSNILTELGNTFVQYAQFLKNTAIDKSLFVWAAVYKQLVALGHHLIVVAILMLFGLVPVTFYTLLAIPAIAVLFLLSIPIVGVIAILFARYRDLQRLVASLPILIMLTTPIFWQPSMLTGWRTAIIYLNPVYYVIEFVRRPLLGQPPDLLVVVVVLGLTAFTWIAGSWFYRRHEKYVVFWV